MCVQYARVRFWEDFARSYGGLSDGRGTTVFETRGEIKFLKLKLRKTDPTSQIKSHSVSSDNETAEHTWPTPGGTCHIAGEAGFFHGL